MGVTAVGEGGRARRFLGGVLILGEMGRVGEQVGGQSGPTAGVAECWCCQSPAQPQSHEDREAGGGGDRPSSWGSLGPMERIPVFTSVIFHFHLKERSLLKHTNICPLMGINYIVVVFNKNEILSV